MILLLMSRSAASLTLSLAFMASFMSALIRSCKVISGSVYVVVEEGIVGLQSTVLFVDAESSGLGIAA